MRRSRNLFKGDPNRANGSTWRKHTVSIKPEEMQFSEHAKVRGTITDLRNEMLMPNKVQGSSPFDYGFDITGILRYFKQR